MFQVQNRKTTLLIALFLLLGVGSQAKEFSILTWNIWVGGQAGPKSTGYAEDPKYAVNTTKVLAQEQADIVFMQETYCCGMESAKKAGYPHSVRGSSNLSIHSKYPILEHIELFKSFNSHGALIDIDGQKVLCFNIWLHYLPDYFNDIKTKSPEELEQGEHATRFAEIKQIVKEVNEIAKKYPGVPVVIGGDFNSGSHLDWIEETRENHYGKVVNWPVSKHMEEQGFTDSFRRVNTDVENTLQGTWGYLWDSIISDRIDFLYIKGGLKTKASKIVMKDPKGGFFNSDHRAIKSVFELE